MEQRKGIAILEWMDQNTGAGSQLTKKVLPSAAMVYEGLAEINCAEQMIKVDLH